MNRKDISREFRIDPDTRIDLRKYPTDADGELEKDGWEKTLEDNIERMYKLQHLMYAEDRHAILIILQGMDTSGKDSTIRHVMRGMNPMGCTVASFKAPVPEEIDHDFLWRVHKAVPRIGEFGIFNRSHYEDAIVPKVHKTIAASILEQRYRQINDFERMLSENGTVILKFFLHISREEQKKRLLERMNDPEKFWKMDPADLEERKLWDRYQRAYEEAIERCSPKHAPWYVIPSDRKWVRNLAVSQIIVEALEALGMRYPKAKKSLSVSFD
ncbi:MAG: polyphosphate kinase 2 family protein [Candidatus Altiarchaeia archaeon]